MKIEGLGILLIQSRSQLSVKSVMAIFWSKKLTCKTELNIIWLTTLFITSVITSHTVFALDVNALPDPKQLAITSGVGDISTNANVMTVKQSTTKMIVEWNNFNIGSSAHVVFEQPSSTNQ